MITIQDKDYLVEDSNLTIESGCQISHLGTISIDVTGLGPLDWVLEMLVDLIANLFRVRAQIM